MRGALSASTSPSQHPLLWLSQTPLASAETGSHRDSHQLGLEAAHIHSPLLPRTEYPCANRLTHRHLHRDTPFTDIHTCIQVQNITRSSNHPKFTCMPSTDKKTGAAGTRETARRGTGHAFFYLPSPYVPQSSEQMPPPPQRPP